MGWILPRSLTDRPADPSRQPDTPQVTVYSSLFQRSADALGDADERTGRSTGAAQAIDVVRKRSAAMAARGRCAARWPGREISTVLGRNLCRLKVSPSIFLSITEKDSKYENARQDALSFSHEATTRDIKENAPGKCHE
jgi:hypothetical protein